MNLTFVSTLENYKKVFQKVAKKYDPFEEQFAFAYLRKLTGLLKDQRNARFISGERYSIFQIIEPLRQALYFEGMSDSVKEMVDRLISDIEVEMENFDG